jgi:tetratricopeptide (TPR) repeat protein
VMFPARPGVELPPLVDGVQPVGFPGPEKAVRWARSERANLNAIILRLAAAGRHSHHYASKLPSAIGEIFDHLGYRHETAEYLRIAVRHAEIMGDHSNKASWLGNLAFIEIKLGEFDSAQRNILEAKELYEQLGDPVDIAITDYYLGYLMVERGDLRNGMRIYLSVLAELERMNATGEAIMVRIRLGEAYRRMGEIASAKLFLQIALHGAERLTDTRSEGNALVELAEAHLEEGDLAAAKDHCLRALRITEDTDPIQTGRAYAILASVHDSRAEYRSGELCARRALTHYRSARDSRGQARTLRILGQLLYCQARHDEATDTWSLAAPLLESAGDHQAAAAVRERLADATTRATPRVPPGRTDSLRHSKRQTPPGQI